MCKLMDLSTMNILNLGLKTRFITLLFSDRRQISANASAPRHPPLFYAFTGHSLTLAARARVPSVLICHLLIGG